MSLPTTPIKRINEYRKITTNEEFKDKRKEKQDIQRQKLKNQFILEKRQKLSTLNQNNLITIDTIKNELKELYNKLKLLNQHKKFSSHQRKQILVSLRNLLSSNNSNIAVDLLVNYKDDSSNNNNNSINNNSLKKSTLTNNSNNKMDTDKTKMITTTLLTSKIVKSNENENENNLFINFLIKMLNDPLDDSNQLEAAWCITNIASCEHEHTKSILLSTPLLINHLSTRNSTLQDQCCWALGNIALDSIKQRDILLHQGILEPVIEMLSSKIPSLTITTCFTLSSLLSSDLPVSSKQVYLDLFKDNKIFQLINDQVLFRKNRIELKNSKSDSSSSDKNNQIEVLNYLLWLLNDVLFQFDIFNQVYPNEYLKIESKLINSSSDGLKEMVLIIMDLFINIFNKDNDQSISNNLKLLIIPCIRIFSLVVIQFKIFIPILHNSTNKIKSLLEIINNNLVLNNSNNNNNSDNGLLKEIFYFLSNLSNYSNQQNQINGLIMGLDNSGNNSLIVNSINKLNNSESSSIKDEIIFLIANIYLDRTVSKDSYSIINHIILNYSNFILPITINIIRDYQLNILDLQQQQNQQQQEFPPQQLQQQQYSLNNLCEFLNRIILEDTARINFQNYESGFNQIFNLNQNLIKFNNFNDQNILYEYFSLLDNISKLNIINKQPTNK